MRLDFDVSAAVFGHVLTVEEVQFGLAGIGRCRCGWESDETWHNMTSPTTAVYPLWRHHALSSIAEEVEVPL